MPTHNSFRFSSSLPDENNLPKRLRLNDVSYEEYTIIRLIIGTLDIEHALSGDIIEQRKDFSKLSFQINARQNKTIISDCINPLKINEFEKYISHVQYNNKRFYQNLLSEFSNYFYFSNKGSNTTAFLHLYRSLEYISFTFPLIFTSIANDYFGAFEQLKSYFSTANSELKFFNNFINKLYSDSLILDTHLNFLIVAPNDALKERYFKIIRSLVNSNNIKAFSEFDNLAISYGSLLDFVINLRNRYFHFLSGTYQSNISSKEIPESDCFFAIINDHIFNWLSFILISIIKKKIVSIACT